MRKNIFLITLLSCFLISSSVPAEESKYLNAVRTFADNVLQYGRDTYGPKHTPLFVDGLNIRTHEPIKWISPKGDVFKATETEEWIISNFASQQTLLRTLDGLSSLTGDPKYRDAANQAIQYAFKNLRRPNGLFYWGLTAAYDVQADTTRAPGGHCLKMDYPHYELMWQVNPDETKRFIDAYWSAHVIDWLNLDFNRIGDVSDTQPKPWDHEYGGGPKFFKSKLSWAYGFFHTGTSLAHAGTTLSRLSGQEQPLVWSKRLIKRFVETRHPKTGISAYQYNQPLRKITGDDIEEHFTDPRTGIFPFYPWDIGLCHGENVQPLQWISVLLVGDSLSNQGEEFTQWATEEFTSWAKASYRKSDNVFVPILTDGTNLDGYVFKADCALGFKGTVLKPLFADLRYFWAYSIGYRMTGDKFMWQMARDISSGNHLGDIGQDQGQRSELRMDTACSDVYGLLGFLELYNKTHQAGFLAIARLIADNILETEFHGGFFVLSKKHIYSRFDCFEPLALLHLVAAIESKPRSVPRLWPSSPLFVLPYRFKQEGNYPRIIYRLTGSPEVPISLQEAAATGDINAINSLLKNGTNVDNIDDSFGKTALHRAAISGHKDVARLLIDAGARLDAKTGGSTPLHFAIENGHKDMVQLLVTAGADLYVKNQQGRTPLHMAALQGNREIVEALVAHGADVNVKDNRGITPLVLAQRRRRTDIVEILTKAAEEKTGVHDIVVTEVSAHTSCVQGDTVSIIVTLGNRGDSAQSCTVTLMDATNDKEIARQSATINSKHRAASEANLAITGEVEDTTEFGNWCCADGDVNGDGFNDLLITAHHYPSKGVDKGRAYLYYGGPLMNNTPDKRFTGEEVGDTLGGNAGFLVDMNNDNFDDVILGARHHNGRGRVYIFYGGTDMDEKADIIIDPPVGDGTDLSFGRGGMHPGDFNGDGIMDLVCSAVKYKGYTGRVYLYYGPLASDTTVDKMFTGEATNDTFGAIIGVGDVDGDNCDDLLVATRYYPANTGVGRAYLYYGAHGTSMDTTCDIMFDPPDRGKNEFGSSADVFDIDNDGFAEVIIGARACSRYRGRVYLYWGKSSGFDDSVGLTFTGEVVNSALGGDFINCGYADDDQYGDILITAYAYNSQQSRAYLYYGGPQGSMDAVADCIFTPESGKNGVFRSALADLNNDSYGDVVMAGAYYNNLQGRAWLWYGPFNTSTDITFNWDTTNATPGKHVLKAAIAPVAGEEDTADNSVTVTVEVKERLESMVKE